MFILVGLTVYLWTAQRKKKNVENTEEVLAINTAEDIPAKFAELFQETGFAYDPLNNCFYTVKDPWQKEFGYCRLYDEAAAPLSMIIDCEPVTFDYNGKHWLIELWKGQYGMLSGCEVGIYNTAGPELNIPGVFNGTFYNAVPPAEELDMAITLIKNNQILFSRKSRHWWLTGFVLGEFSQPEDLMVEIRIQFPNGEMLKAFADGLQNLGYSTNNYRTEGNAITILYDLPHAAQPVTRTPLLEYIMQKQNKSFCDSYLEITKDAKTMWDKVLVLREKSPELFNYLVQNRAFKDLYAGYQLIQKGMEAAHAEETG